MTYLPREGYGSMMVKEFSSVQGNDGKKQICSGCLEWEKGEWGGEEWERKGRQNGV